MSVYVYTVCVRVFRLASAHGREQSKEEMAREERMEQGEGKLRTGDQVDRNEVWSRRDGSV